MLFLRLTNSSFKRNFKIYTPYLMATTILVTINYIFFAVSANASLNKLSTKAVTTGLLDLGSKFIILVTIAFLIYVNRFLWQQRSKEMGLYSMLGMTSRNLQLLTIIEKCYLMIISLGAGLIIGIIFEKLAFLGLAYLLKIEHLSQPLFVPKAITETIVLTVGLFILITVIDLIKLSRLTPEQLWNFQAKVNRHHGFLFILAGILGLACLSGAYYITLTIKPRISAISHFLIAVILLVFGTYLVFIAGSIIFLRLLQKNKHFYYKPRHFIAISGMLQRMEQNGASLATICLLCSSILVILFTSLTLYAGINNTVSSYAPTDIVLTTSKRITPQQRSTVNLTAKRYNAKITDFMSYKMTVPQYGYWRKNKFITEGNIEHMTSMTTSSVIMLTTTEFNRITDQHVHLDDGEALGYSNKGFHHQSITINHHTYQVKKLSHFNKYFNPDRSIYTPMFLVVNNIPTGNQLMTVTNFNYHLRGNVKQQIKFENVLQNKLGMTSSSFAGKATLTSLINGMYGSLVFIGILISIALAITTTVVIYFKQISEGYADRKRFQTMQEVGLSERETVKSIRSQVLMVFLLPILGAVINLGFAIPAIRQIMAQLSFYNLNLMIIVGVIVTVSLLLLYLMVYGTTTKTYQRIVDAPIQRINQ